MCTFRSARAAVHGRAFVFLESMPGAPDYAAVAVKVEHVDDHRQPASVVEAGVDRRWLDESEQRALGNRVETLKAAAGL